MAILLTITLTAARPGIKKVPASTTTEVPTTLPPSPGADEVIDHVRAAVADQQVQEAQQTAAVQYEIEQANMAVAEELERAQLAAANRAQAAEAVRRDTEEAMAVMNELNTIGADLRPYDSRYFNAGAGQPSVNGYIGHAGSINPGIGGWNQGFGAWNNPYVSNFYGAYSNPHRRSYYEPYFGGFNGGFNGGFHGGFNGGMFKITC